MTIDTQIRHITPPGANLLLELGFEPAQAEQLQAESQKQINDTKAFKAHTVLGPRKCGITRLDPGFQMRCISSRS